MKDEEHKRWEQYYKEAVEKDFARRVYEQCDREDEERE